MEPDFLELYERASAWTAPKVRGADNKLDAPTPCDEWDVATLMNHMLDTRRYFIASARGEDASPQGPNPPKLIREDPVAAFAAARDDMLEAYGEPGVIEKTGPSLGIAFSDQLLHGWDLAKATAQDATMPKGLAEAAFTMIHGRFTEEQTQGRVQAGDRCGVERDGPGQAAGLHRPAPQRVLTDAVGGPRGRRQSSRVSQPPRYLCRTALWVDDGETERRCSRGVRSFGRGRGVVGDGVRLCRSVVAVAAPDRFGRGRHPIVVAWV